MEPSPLYIGRHPNLLSCPTRHVFLKISCTKDIGFADLRQYLGRPDVAYEDTQTPTPQPFCSSPVLGVEACVFLRQHTAMTPLSAGPGLTRLTSDLYLLALLALFPLQRVFTFTTNVFLLMDTPSGGTAAVSHIASQTSEASIKLLLQVSKGLWLTAIHPIPPQALFMWKAEEHGESQKR